LSALVSYTERFSALQEYHTNRFAERVGFAPLFKVVHGLANQLGLSWHEEAYSHHLLLSAIAPDIAERRVAR
jgi:hypothetical protein